MTEANLGEAPEAATSVDAGAHQQLFGEESKQEALFTEAHDVLLWILVFIESVEIIPFLGYCVMH